MKIIRPFWKSNQPRRVARKIQPASAMFGKVRLQLTLWYSAMLTLTLLLLEIGLYFFVQQQLFARVINSLDDRVNIASQHWAKGADHNCGISVIPPTPPNPNGGPGLPLPSNFYIACFDPQARLIIAGKENTDIRLNAPDPFVNNKLAASLLKTGNLDAAQDIVDEQNGAGLTLYRYARLVLIPDTGGKLGVLQAGASVGDLLITLNVLRNLLIGLSIITLFGSILGGLFLAGRALAPTNRAFTLQQSFIADASHEFRTPLTILRADAEVLLRSRHNFADEDVALVEDIVIEAERMTSLANSLLELARLDAGQLKISQETVNLADLTTTVARRLRTLAQEKEIMLQTENTQDLQVVGDSQLLEQLILILADNGIKYTPNGGKVSIQSGYSPEGLPQVQICDTGVGIEKEHLNHLGERFYRVDKARSREIGGTGLGLALAYQIARSHQASLDIISTPGKGTTVKLILPAKRIVHT